jgi:hypothetical protein
VYASLERCDSIVATSSRAGHGRRTRQTPDKFGLFRQCSAMLSPFLESELQMNWYGSVDAGLKLVSIRASELGVIALLVGLIDLVKVAVQLCQMGFLLFCERGFKVIKVFEAQVIIDIGYENVDSASLSMYILPMFDGL